MTSGFGEVFLSRGAYIRAGGGGYPGRGGIFRAGFFGLAGAEGVEDAPFAGAAAEGWGIELAEISRRCTWQRGAAKAIGG